MPEKKEKNAGVYEGKTRSDARATSPGAPNGIASRGIPAGEALWLPRHDEVREILKKQSDPFDEYGVEWTVADVLEFVFPSRYRALQHEVATQFIDFLAANAGQAPVEITHPPEHEEQVEDLHHHELGQPPV